MRCLFMALGCALLLGLVGCSHETPPAPKTDPPAVIQAEISKVQNDPKIPPQAKGNILGHLQGELQQAQQKSSGSP